MLSFDEECPVLWILIRWSTDNNWGTQQGPCVQILRGTPMGPLGNGLDTCKWRVPGETRRERSESDLPGIMVCFREESREGESSLLLLLFSQFPRCGVCPKPHHTLTLPFTVFFWFFETMSSLELYILCPLPLECCDCRCTPPYLDFFHFVLYNLYNWPFLALFTQQNK
jgi:hypothetical protein